MPQARRRRRRLRLPPSGHGDRGQAATALHWALRSIPEISRRRWWSRRSARGRVLAMQGGFDVRGSDFNRATQALRQPGSTFKPIVYSAALDNGMTPASIIVDGPFCVWQGAGLGRNASATSAARSAGPQTMRWGVEQSRNLMTVRDRQPDRHGQGRRSRAHELGVGDYPQLSRRSRSAPATPRVARMVNAYSILANQGRAVKPDLDRLCPGPQRQGHLPRRHAALRRLQRARLGRQADAAAAAPDQAGRRPDDRLSDRPHHGRRRSSAAPRPMLRDLNRPLFGKTGTTSGPTNVWFVGGTPQIVAGVYIGYDQPRPLGGYAQGGTLAAPIFKQFAHGRARRTCRWCRSSRRAGHPHGPRSTAHRASGVRRLARRRRSEGRRSSGRRSSRRASRRRTIRRDR